MLKLRFPISPPRRDDGTLLPAALCLLLAGCLVAQFLLVGAPDLPQEAVGRVALNDIARGVPPVTVPPVIAARPLFSPTRLSGTTPIATAGDTAGPLGGAIVAGAITRRGAGRVFLRQPDGTIRGVPIGGVYAGWRVLSVTGGAVRLARGRDVITIPFGSTAPASTKTSEGDDDASSDEQ